MKIPCPPTSPAAMHLDHALENPAQGASLHSTIAGRASKHRCYKILHPGADAGLHAVLHNDRAGHSRADQHPFRQLRQTNADGNAWAHLQSDERCGSGYRSRESATRAAASCFLFAGSITAPAAGALRTLFRNQLRIRGPSGTGSVRINALEARAHVGAFPSPQFGSSPRSAPSQRRAPRSGARARVTRRTRRPDPPA
jgi:hypothetical protein